MSLLSVSSLWPSMMNRDLDSSPLSAIFLLHEVQNACEKERGRETSGGNRSNYSNILDLGLKVFVKGVCSICEIFLIRTFPHVPALLNLRKRKVFKLKSSGRSGLDRERKSRVSNRRIT